jgi:hypothetical protein
MGDNRPLNPYIKGRIFSYIGVYFIPQLDENVVKVASLHSYFLSLLDSIEKKKDNF